MTTASAEVWLLRGRQLQDAQYRRPCAQRHALHPCIHDFPVWAITCDDPLRPLRLPHRRQQSGCGRGNLAQNEKLIPTVLKPAGYVTTMIGKWSQFSLQPSDFRVRRLPAFCGQRWLLEYPGENEDLRGQRGNAAAARQGIHAGSDAPSPDRLYHETSRPPILRPLFSLPHARRHSADTDSAPDSKDHYADNVAYMDKLVGKLMAELDRLKLREHARRLFGDNGTANPGLTAPAIGGRRLAGAKGSMLDGGGRVPMIVVGPGSHRRARFRRPR